MLNYQLNKFEIKQMKMTTKSVLESANITQEELAAILSISQSAVSQRIKRDSEISIDDALKISRKTDLSISDIRPDFKS